jgi:hypothetical protein
METTTIIRERLEAAIAGLPPQKLEQLAEFAEFLKTRSDVDAELQKELKEWQALGEEAWAMIEKCENQKL